MRLSPKQPGAKPAPVDPVMADLLTVEIDHLDDVHLVALGRLPGVLPDDRPTVAEVADRCGTIGRDRWDGASSPRQRSDGSRRDPGTRPTPRPGSSGSTDFRARRPDDTTPTGSRRRGTAPACATAQNARASWLGCIPVNLFLGSKVMSELSCHGSRRVAST